MDLFKRAGCTDIGVGGYNCPCCGPSRSEKKALRQRARARLKQDTKKAAVEFFCYNFFGTVV